MKKQGLRVSIDDREEKLNYKIRESQTKKIPYTLVLGDNEANSESVTYRHFGTTESVNISLSDFVNKLVEEVQNLGK